MIPETYDLKRVVARHWPRFWCGEELRGLITAPVYHFADQEAFDSDEVDLASRQLPAGPLRLPHLRVAFEVADQGEHRRALVAYAWETEAAVEAMLVTRLRACRRWTDVLARAHFRADGWAEIDGNPCGEPLNDDHPYARCLTGMVWRSLAILAEPGTATEQSVSRVHRPKFANAGIRGWTWHQVEIVPARLVRTSEPLGGSHASPRWHIRRGHWRQLADGRRVFVRACEVGDAERGRVLKDYLVGDRAA